MSAEILDNTEGILSIRISGKLRNSELATAQKTAAEMLKKRGGSRVMVLAEKFDGWEKGDDWGDLSAQTQLDAQIDRMAIVGEKRWEDVALLFTGKGIRHIEIEYFSPPDLPRARSWLSSSE